MTKIVLERTQGNYGFEVKDELQHVILTDSSRETGGQDYGFRPMQLLLAGIGSCSAIDLVSILTKQKQQIKTFKIEVNGEREKDVIPSLWKTIHVHFYLAGTIEQEKAERAAALSMEKYCSVAETLRRAGTIITWQTTVEK
jgi:putative redox protein